MNANRKKVLLVEDEDNIALALEIIIGRNPALELTRVATGGTALAALEHDRPDLVVLDVMLPERSGFEICQHIRQSDGMSDVKVLMMSAAGTDVMRRKGLALGADAFFTKPFDTKDLTRAIEELLNLEPSGA